MRLPISISHMLAVALERIEYDFEKQAQGEGPLFVTLGVMYGFDVLKRHLEALRTWDNGGYKPHYKRTYNLIVIAEEAAKLSNQFSDRGKFSRLRLINDLDLNDDRYLPIPKDTSLANAVRVLSILAEDAAIRGGHLWQISPTNDDEANLINGEFDISGDAAPIALDLRKDSIQSVFPEPHRELITHLQRIREAVFVANSDASSNLQRRFDALEQSMSEALDAQNELEQARRLYVVGDESARLLQDVNLPNAIVGLGEHNTQERIKRMHLSLILIGRVALDFSVLQDDQSKVTDNLRAVLSHGSVDNAVERIQLVDEVVQSIIATSEVVAEIVDGKLTPVEGPGGLFLIHGEVDFHEHLGAQRLFSSMIADDCEREQLPHATVRLFRRYATVIAEPKVVWFLADDLIKVIREVRPAVETGWSEHAAAYIKSLITRHVKLRSYLKRKNSKESKPEILKPITEENRSEISDEIQLILSDETIEDDLSASGALFLGHIAEKVKSADPKEVESAVTVLAGFILSARDSLNQIGEKHKGLATIVSVFASLAGLLLKFFGK